MIKLTDSAQCVITSCHVASSRVFDWVKHPSPFPPSPIPNNLMLHRNMPDHFLFESGDVTWFHPMHLISHVASLGAFGWVTHSPFPPSPISKTLILYRNMPDHFLVEHGDVTQLHPTRFIMSCGFLRGLWLSYTSWSSPPIPHTLMPHRNK